MHFWSFIAKPLEYIAVSRMQMHPHTSGTSKKSPNVYKSCPKWYSIEKWKILTTHRKLPKHVGSLGIIIIATGFEKFFFFFFL